MLGGQKGQEAAPFNLIIAGIMIAFTMVVLAYLFINFNTNFCLNELKSNAEIFVREIEHSAQYTRNNTEITVNLNFQSCGDISIKNFTIEKLDPSNCTRYCGASNCRLFLINGEIEGSKTQLEPICIKIPFNTTLKSDCSDGLAPIPALVFEPKVYRLKLIKMVGDGETVLNICEVT